MAITSADRRPICLDLTRLASRIGMGANTGVDRVERAYLDRLLLLEVPAFGLIRTAAGFSFLDRSGLEAFRRLADGEIGPGALDIPGRLSLRLSRFRRATESTIRRCASCNVSRGSLSATAKRFFAPTTRYFNVGHSNLDRSVLSALRAAEMDIAIMIHDTIPLDWPDLQRPGTPDRFRRKLDAALSEAATILCNSNVTRLDVLRHGDALSRGIDLVVAPLGIDRRKDDAAVADDPYFVIVGTIEPRKNHDFLLDLWTSFVDELGPRTPRLVIAGRRGWLNEAVFHRLDTDDRLRPFFTERADLDDSALAALMRGSRAALFPSIAEGFGFPVGEAIEALRPVLCAPLPVYREAFGDWPTCIPLDRPDLWRAEIRDLSGRPRVLPAHARDGLPRWDAHFNIVFGSS